MTHLWGGIRVIPGDGVEMGGFDREKHFDFSDRRGVQLCKGFLLGRRATLTASVFPIDREVREEKGIVCFHMSTWGS